MDTLYRTLAMLLAVSLLSQYVVGCDTVRSKQEVLTQLSDESDFISQVTTNFPDVPQFITHQTGEYGPQAWHITLGVYDRYLLEIQMPIVWDDKKGDLLGHEEPSFYFRRIESIALETGGGTRVKYDNDFDCIEDFDMDDWVTLSENNFVFSKAFPCLNDNDQLQHFQYYIDRRHGK